MTELKVFDQSRLCVSSKITHGTGEGFELVSVDTLDMVAEFLVGLRAKGLQV